jgi:hypothetical protein
MKDCKRRNNNEKLRRKRIGYRRKNKTDKRGKELKN